MRAVARSFGALAARTPRKRSVACGPASYFGQTFSPGGKVLLLCYIQVQVQVGTPCRFLFFLPQGIASAERWTQLKRFFKTR